MAFTFKRAERMQLKLRLALIGPSGAGKTYSALRLATGLTGGKARGKIALIDTENRRGEYYADEFEYDTLNFEPPFAPERYVEAIHAAEEAGYEVVIIDSASHEWMGPGGILDIKDKMPGGNDYVKWGTLTPRHDAFVAAIVRCKAHVIVCLRGKDQYILETNDKGKQAPKKVGVGAQQRDGLEYECTVAWLIDQEKHVATATKDNTHLFEGRYEVLAEADGELLYDWANDGKAVPPPLSPAEREKYIGRRKRLLAERGIGRADYDGCIAGLIARGELAQANGREWTAAEWEAALAALGSLDIPGQELEVHSA